MSSRLEDFMSKCLSSAVLFLTRYLVHCSVVQARVGGGGQRRGEGLGLLLTSCT